MKKTLSFILTLIISSFWIFVNAQWWIWDLIDSLWNEITFWYNANQKITVKEISDEKVIIESPLIKKDGIDILKYTIMYSEYPLTEILENTTLLNQTKEKSFDISSQDPFSMELNLADGINPTTKYYLFVIPKDVGWNLWEVSNEIWFNISEKTYWDAWSSEIYTTQTVHSAAWADMSLANITHTINWNTITLKWIAVDWSNTIDLSVMTPGSSSFNRVATVSMDSQSYSFTASRNWEYIFQFTPDNQGKQVNYTLQMNTAWWWETPGPVIPVVPKTWPMENSIVIIIAAFLWYLIYRKLYRKAK